MEGRSRQRLYKAHPDMDPGEGGAVPRIQRDRAWHPEAGGLVPTHPASPHWLQDPGRDSASSGFGWLISKTGIEADSPRVRGRRLVFLSCVLGSTGLSLVRALTFLQQRYGMRSEIISILERRGRSEPSKRLGAAAAGGGRAQSHTQGPVEGTLAPSHPVPP